MSQIAEKKFPIAMLSFEATVSSFSGALATPDFPPDVLPNIRIFVSNTV